MLRPYTSMPAPLHLATVLIPPYLCRPTSPVGRPYAKAVVSGSHRCPPRPVPSARPVRRRHAARQPRDRRAAARAPADRRGSATLQRVPRTRLLGLASDPTQAEHRPRVAARPPAARPPPPRRAT